MKVKCPICLSCLDIIYIGFSRFFRCEFCDKTYNIHNGKLMRVIEVVLKEDRNGNNVVKEVKYYEEDVG